MQAPLSAQCNTLYLCHLQRQSASYHHSLQALLVSHIIPYLLDYYTGIDEEGNQGIAREEYAYLDMLPSSSVKDIDLP